MVDTQDDPAEYIKLAKRLGLEIIAVLETHIQADHVSSSPQLAKIANAPMYFGSGAEVEFDFEELADGQTIEVGRRKIKAIYTPGHTAEHICLMVDDWLVMTGDTLFVGDVGRVDLVKEGTEKEQLKAKAKNLYKSIQKLLELPDWIEIYPGHYKGSACGKGMDSKASSTIGRERRKNEVLNLDEQGFIKYVLENQLPAPADFLKIKHQNSAE